METDKKRAQRIEELDRQISELRKTLSELSVTRTEDGTADFPLFRRKKMLEKEIQRQTTVLHLLLEDQPRPWYLHRLPREVLAKILEWVTDPAEQLKLLRTFPMLGPLMKWEESTLIFKQVFPLIADHLKDPFDMWKLCMVSPGFMGVVLEHLTADLSRNIEWNRDLSFMEWDALAKQAQEFEDLGRTSWMAEMPLLIRPLFYLGGQGGEQMDEEGVVVTIPQNAQSFLDAHGSQIWSCRIAVNSAQYSANRAGKLMNQILKALPNLVRLHVSGSPFSLYANSANYPVPWVDLPKLRALHVTDCECSPLMISVIEKYSPQLRALYTDWEMDAPVTQGGHFPRLEYYEASCWSGPDLQNQFPASILDAPLKSISLTWPETNWTRGEQCPNPEVLTTLSHFGNTLESLTLGMYKYAGPEDPRMLDIRSEFITDIKMPKLRHLKLFCRARNLDWLLVLPSLETLELKRLVQNGVFLDESPSSLLQFPRSWASRYSTNIWKHLHTLEKFRMLCNVAETGEWLRQSVVTSTRRVVEGLVQNENDGV